MDTDLSPRTALGMGAILAEIEAHGDAVESDYLELKSSLNLRDALDLAKIAKFILGAASRGEAQAAANFHGEAVMVIGAGRGESVGIPRGIEEYQLRDKLRPYLGQHGPRFHVQRHFLASGREVLFVVVEAPKAGDPLFPCHKDFQPINSDDRKHALQDGALYVRPGSNTRLARAGEVLDLQERYRSSTAQSVSAWVEVTAAPSSHGDRYLRRTIVHVDNQSDLPVYNANVCVGLQHAAGDWIPVGPLAVPLPLPVLAAKSQQQWDITVALLACTPEEGGLNQHPAAAMAFSDPQGQRWQRSFDGTLTRSEPGDAELFASNPAHAEAQAGPMDTLFNPIAVVSFFINAVLGDSPEDRELARFLTDPAAPGWDEITAAQWDEMARELHLGLAAHVYYPAPRVAYVRALTDEAAATRRTGGAGFVSVPLKIFTLRLLLGQGWRIHTFGEAVRPDMIHFPEGDLDQDVM